MFVDQAEIWVKAGNGGNGCLSFRREKYIPKGGPDGGDGGDGGNIILQVDSHLRTLLDFKYRQQYKAETGRAGQGAKKAGKNGKDLIIKVPQGTVIKNSATGEIIGDLVQDNRQIVVAKGGRGGRGNARFATPTNRTPRQYESGTTGESLQLSLELKLLADIGLVGLPNVGKSTLLSCISAARPKIADYPFTTLTPNLGIVRYKDHHTFVVADIPGLIEGAHLGKGLGIQFLRHIERTRVIAFLVESKTPSILEDIRKLKNELSQYNPLLLEKPSFVVITKIDLMANSESENCSPLAMEGFDYCKISAVTGEGIEAVKTMMWNYLERYRNQ